MFNIKKYHNILREYNIEEKEGHLLANCYNAKAVKTNIVRDLFSALGDLRADNEMFRLQKLPSCHFDNCVSPQCYTFNLKSNFTKGLLTKEDIIEIAGDMDLEEINELGPEEYLKKYNESMPDFLKLSPADFRTIYAYMKGSK